MNQPTPAIVAQTAVRRLPRVALLLLCVAYVLAGFVGREPWKNQEVTAFGYMAELASGASAWFDPRLLGQPPELDALVPYWLGAWAMQWLPLWVAPDFASRIPSILLLALTLCTTWYGVYYLARSPSAQPVAFAFGGEARPADYARALADGGLLALISCLGLAQLSHETTPAQAQLCFSAITFYAFAALPYRTGVPALGVAVGLFGLSLSGAPALAALFGIGGAGICLLEGHLQAGDDDDVRLDAAADRGRGVRWAWAVLAITAAAAATVWALGLWRWRIAVPPAHWNEWRSLGRLLLWFTWPIWPMAIWTLWRWRRHMRNGRPDRHLALPLWFIAVGLGTTVFTPASDRSLLLTLPALAALAAFALPTLGRSVAAAIDWFTLLFFTSCALIVWVIWIAMQTGVPAKPAANVAKLAPGFEPSFSLTAFVVALAATLSWAWLVRWRVGRHPSVIWKSLVLPAGGTALCWMLLTTLWLPPLDFARSYAPLVRNVMAKMPTTGCVEIHGLNRGQIAAFRFHGGLQLRPAATQASCPWLLVDAQALSSLLEVVDMPQWVLQASVRRPTDKTEDVLLFRRAP